MNKEINEPIHINPILKEFMVYMKLKLKRKFNKFYAVSSTLLYYLKDSKKFCDDYGVYCKLNNITNDIITKETIKKEEATEDNDKIEGIFDGG